MAFRETMARLLGVERRNMAFPPSFLVTPNATAWNWAQLPKVPIEKAVKDGLKACGWVYRAVTIISRNAAAVPWGLRDIASGEFDWEHPLSLLMANPCPDLSRLDLFVMLNQWQQLTGEAYFWRNIIGGQTVELWPVSPERLRPVPSMRADMMLTGYNERTGGGWLDTISSTYTRDNMVPFRFIDPADPLRGISPLESAARSIDIDVEQQKFNASAMQNRGVIDTVISYKEALTQEQYEAVKEQIKARMSGSSNAREPYVTGGAATVHRLGLTPVEMDFIASRKWNMTEIFAIFGVPVQLGAAVDAMTYDNYSISRRVLWEMTILPTLDDQMDTLNRALGAEIPNGSEIAYDTSGVKALKEDDERVAKVAKLYFDMGVPVSIINDRLGLGLSDYPGDTLPWGGRSTALPASTASREAPMFRMVERRDVEAEQKARDDWADGPAWTMYKKLFAEQQATVFEMLDAGRSTTEMEQYVRDSDGWLEKMQAMGAAIAIDFGTKITMTRNGKSPLIEYRDEFTDAFEAELATYFDREKWMLTELSLLSETTVNLMLEQIQDGLSKGATVQDIKQALQDVGAFSPERALMLARTLAGTSASIGQLSAAKVSGAQRKQWMTSGFEVRKIHQAREGETVAIDSTFSNQGHGNPRFPLDPQLSPGDRVNCLLPGTEVQGRFVGAMRASYAGQAVEIVMRSGSLLRVTKNHPILTKHGFIPAGVIKQGDELLHYVGDDQLERATAATLPANEDHKVPTVEQVFGALASAGFGELRRRASADFDGDGKAINGDVKIVWSDRKLLDSRKASIFDLIGDLVLVGEDPPPSQEIGSGSGVLGSGAIVSSSGSNPSGSALSFDSFPAGFDGFPFESFGFGSASGFDVGFTQSGHDGGSGDAELFSKLLNADAGLESRDNGNRITDGTLTTTRSVADGDSMPSEEAAYRGDGSAEIAGELRSGFPGTVSVDEVISVRRFEYTGHVYDLQSVHGWIVANGTFVSNCRCSMSFEG